MANWAKDFEGAVSPEDVLVFVNDYLRTLPSGLASWLPRACRPPYPLSHPDEIRSWHDAITRECGKPGASYNPRLQEHGVIFVCALRRLDELASAAPRPGGSKATTSSSADPA